MNRTIIEIIASAGSTFAFGILFNLKGKKLIAASIGGVIGWIIYIYFKHNGTSEPGAFFLSSIGITIYSEIIARVLKTPVTSTLIASLIPLVPGSGIYFTMSYFVENKIPEATQRGIDTLLVTIAITLHSHKFITKLEGIIRLIKKLEIEKEGKNNSLFKFLKIYIDSFQNNFHHFH